MTQPKTETSDYIMRTALSIALDLVSRKIDFEAGAMQIIELVEKTTKSLTQEQKEKQ